MDRKYLKSGLHSSARIDGNGGPNGFIPRDLLREKKMEKDEREKRIRAKLKEELKKVIASCFEEGFQWRESYSESIAEKILDNFKIRGKKCQTGS